MIRDQVILKNTNSFLRRGLLVGLIGITACLIASNANAQQSSQFSNEGRTSHSSKAFWDKKEYRLKRVFFMAREEPGRESRLNYKDHLSRFDVVFMGKLKEKIERLREVSCGYSKEEIEALKEKGTYISCGPPVTESYHVFSIEKAFKGVKGDSVEIFYKDSMPRMYACDNLEIRLGRRYLVYGGMDREKEQFFLSCYTEAVEDADVEMMFLTAVANDMDEARVYAVLPRVAKTHSRGKTRADALRHLKNAPPEIKLPDLKENFIFALRDSNQEVRDLAFRILASDKYLFKPGVLGKLVSVVGNKYSPLSSELIQVLAASASRDEKTISKIKDFLKQQTKLMEKYRNKKPLVQFEYYQKHVQGIKQLLELIKEAKNKNP